MEFKTGKKYDDPQLRLNTSLAQQIFIEALIDPRPKQRNIKMELEKWQVLYWKVKELQKKKREADELCLSRVKRRMAWGLGFLGANIGFIWSGTYIFFSWDIIEPIAYFVSAMGGIVLASQFFKIGKPYSNYAYQKYLIDRLSPAIYK